MADKTRYNYGGDYNRFKLGTFSIATTTASGTQAITGVGFTPASCIFIAVQHGVIGELSWGMDDGTNECVYDYYNTTADTYETSSTASIFDNHSSGNTYAGVVNSFDSDGFTIGWTKTGSPTGSLVVLYLARL